MKFPIVLFSQSVCNAHVNITSKGLEFIIAYNNEVSEEKG